MLLRGRSRQPSPSDDGEEGLPIVREKSSTPIYGADVSRGQPDVAVKRQGPKLVRDRLLELMVDSRWHAAHELEQLLPNGEWVRAMRELLSQHFTFDRLSNSFRLRHRPVTERKPVLVELLAGIDATKSEVTVEPSPMPVPVARHAPGEDEKMDFDPSASPEDAVDVGELLALSGDPRDLMLTVSECMVMTAAILAKKSSGKTYLGMVMVEEFLRKPGLGVPTVIVDPTGAWHGLRAMADGTPSSYPILTLGGSHGDLEITHRQGSQAAEIVHEGGARSVLLDLSHMIPSEQHEFVADFGQRIFVLNERSPLHLIIDEADEFAPQVLNSSSRHQKRSLEVIDRIVRRGRTKGFGSTLITQRSAVIAKNVISQIDSLFLLNMVAPSDLEAVNDWMKYGVRADQRMGCLEDLPNLPPGTAYFMQAGASPKFRKFVVRKKLTYDSSRTPKPNEKIMDPVLSRAGEAEIALARRWLGGTVSVEPSESDDDVAEPQD
jgi:hypothetical protein